MALSKFYITCFHLYLTLYFYWQHFCPALITESGEDQACKCGLTPAPVQRCGRKDERLRLVSPQGQCPTLHAGSTKPNCMCRDLGPCRLFILSFFNYSSHSILFCIRFRCTAWWLDNHIFYKDTIHSYQNITDCVSYTLLYIFVAILSLLICTSQSLHLLHSVL